MIGGGDWTIPVISKVVSLGISGWREETDYPVPVRCTSCISVENGLVTVGGQHVQGEVIKTVYLYRDKVWKFAGELNHASLSSY